jgi:hypothetical protein
MKPIQINFFRSFLLLLCLTAFASCDKSKDSTPEPATGLVGRWDMYETTGGFLGQTTAIAPGTKQLEFTADSVVKVYDNKKMIDTHKYSVKRGPSLLRGEQADILYHVESGGRYVPQTMEVDASTLTLSDEMNDGYTYRYRRL